MGKGKQKTYFKNVLSAFLQLFAFFQLFLPICGGGFLSFFEELSSNFPFFHFSIALRVIKAMAERVMLPSQV